MKEPSHVPYIEDDDEDDKDALAENLTTKAGFTMVFVSKDNTFYNSYYDDPGFLFPWNGIVGINSFILVH